MTRTLRLNASLTSTALHGAGHREASWRLPENGPYAPA